MDRARRLSWSWWVSPSTKQPVKPENSIFIRGFVYDTKLLANVRAERLRGVTTRQRLERMADNVALLAVKNLPWPESDFRRYAFRDRLQHQFAIRALAVLAFCALGFAFLRRHRIAALIIAANLLTIVIVAAIYLGEARYRVPYDPMIIVVAAVGAHATVKGAWRLVRRSSVR